MQVSKITARNYFLLEFKVRDPDVFEFFGDEIYENKSEIFFEHLILVWNALLG